MPAVIVGVGLTGHLDLAMHQIDDTIDTIIRECHFTISRKHIFELLQYELTCHAYRLFDIPLGAHPCTIE